MGLAFDGTNIWVANSSENTVSKLGASDGSLVETFSTGGSAPQAISFDGVNIWVT
jgi:DNA-binding beta-propeller fold protein YncE